ncbi:MAG: hypothetical protein QOF76_720 [Solirubrobacteraceae bacterium]|jgi:hypothetical protein|nr:hypothetical protein [Solirubrobacteraceae bacterium]
MTDTITETLPPPPVAPAPSCPSCGATMAHDQRYCLRCGERRGAPRVAFAREPAPPPAAPVPAAPLAEPVRRASTPVWVAAVGVLMLAMGVGVLIGQSGDDAPATAPAAPVTLTIPSGTPAAATPTPTAAAEDSATGKGKKGAGKKGKKGGGAKADTAPVPTISASELQQHENATPEEYNKQSKALPDKIGTSGTPAPKDDKPAGDGGGFETIG